MRPVLESPTLEEQQQLVRTLIQRVVVTPTTIEVQARLRRVQLPRRLSGEVSR